MDSSQKEISRSLGVLFSEGDTIELRCVGHSRAISGYYRDFAKLAQDAHRLNTSFSPRENCYVCLNPCRDDLYGRRANQFAVCGRGEAVKDQDILQRRWLLVDVDPVRPSGVSATDQQKQDAIELAKQVYAWLIEQLGSACMVCADSGNGAHMLIRLSSLANDDEIGSVCQRFLRTLSDRFSNDQAKVDVATHNAARICTLYGSVKRKGSDIPEQPHRMSKLVFVPDPLLPVDWQRMAALVDPYPAQQAASPPAVQSFAVGDALDIDAMLKQRSVEYTRDDHYRTNSGEMAARYELSVCPFNPEHDDRSAWIIRWGNGSIAAGCHHDGCAGKGWPELRQLWEFPGEIRVSDIILPVPQQQRLRSHYTPPTFPQHAFHGPIGQLVQQFAPHTEASPVAMLVTFLTHFGNVVGRRFFVDIGIRQYFKLFTSLVGTTARGRKWTAEENVCRMIDAINPAWAVYRHAGLSSGEGMVQTISDHMEGIYPAPAVFTESEFALVLRKKERKGNSLDGYLRVAWDDAVLSTATRKDPLRVEGSHVSLLAHITPAELKELLTGRDISNGFANRFLWIWTVRPERVQNALSFRPGAQYQPQIKALQQAFQQLDQRYTGKPIQLRLDDAAQQAWPDIYQYLDNVESDEDEGLLVDMNARAPAYAQRIAAIYAVADGATAISIEHLKAAIAITDYSLATVDYVYSKPSWTDRNQASETIQPRAQKVLDAMEVGGQLLRSQVMHKVFQRNRTAKEINAVRDHLASTGEIQVQQTENTEVWTRTR